MSTNKKSNTAPADQKEREKILTQLDKTMLVEAAAGTGKTTSMVGRMVNLVAEGKCHVETLAAVTFTRKAAAELRARFQVALERAAKEATGQERQRLQEAGAYSERSFIGTIHSFCARLLRERPVEAGVDVAFSEVEDVEDARIRREAWSRYQDSLFVTGEALLGELEEVGLEIGQLSEAFEMIAGYPDIREWPAPKVPLPDLKPAASALRAYVKHMQELIPTFPAERGTDKLMGVYEATERSVRLADLGAPAELMEVLTQMMTAGRTIVQSRWPGGSTQAKAELERWEGFLAGHVEPNISAWREHRYEKVIRAVLPAVDVYNQMRHDMGVLNFQDLLMKSADLLRDRPNVRRYFRKRYTHVLVDEFQDTDPVQAEMMLLLTADDPSQKDWRRCRPVPGSLFVVGDPKQSIYRFRRADIVTYNQVRDIIQASGGLLVRLSSNFRSDPSVVDWVNGIFDRVFPPESTTHSPANVPLEAGRTSGADGEFLGVHCLRIPGELSRKEDVVAYEADFVARFIRKALDKGLTIPRSQKEIEAGVTSQVTPGDFLIVSYMKERLGLYAQNLQRLGIPHQVTGGSALNQVDELALLHCCLKVVCEPENPVALVAVLRGRLFGFSDKALYAFRRAGGNFLFRSAVPEELEEAVKALFADAFGKLTRYANWLARLPAVVAIEKICSDLGLMLMAAAAPGGDVQAGSLARAIELLRSAQERMWTAADLVDYLGQLVDREETYDGVSVRPHPQAPVRLMNLHKAKGLEASVVFLADPAGQSDHPVTLHVARLEGKPRGYLAVYGEATGWGKPPLLAHPQRWEELAAEEDHFRDAEAQRLRYVAGTRAGAALVVTQRVKGNHSNPWSFFAEALEKSPALEDPGAAQAPAVKESPFTRKQADAAFLEVADRWRGIAEETYEVVSARGLSLGGETAVAAGQGHGAEWGVVIHLLLQAAMQQPDADLDGIARMALADVGMPADLADKAVETVRAQMSSPLWQRAMVSSNRMVEVPFQMLLPKDEPAGRPLPSVLRGVIDLCFQEPDGWVIVDYKTDAAAATAIDRLVEHYRPQVRLYASAWGQATGQPVKEAGLYFTKVIRYVPC